METVYIETTIVSYLVANPSREPILAAHQQLTRQWWRDERMRYVCVTSPEVLRETALGDAEMSRRRLEALGSLTIIAVQESARSLARALLAEGILPPAAAPDALHAVVASQHHVNILLTWNCRHLANPHVTGRLRVFMDQYRLVLPEICTPVELVGQ